MRFLKKWISRLFPKKKIKNGLSLSFDSCISVDPKLLPGNKQRKAVEKALEGVTEDTVDSLDFYRIADPLAKYEVKKIFDLPSGKKAMELYCINTGRVIVVNEGAFAELFENVTMKPPLPHLYT